MDTVKIGNRIVGAGHPTFLIAEIGINHNGDVEIAKKLIDFAVKSGFEAVKFQKRTVDVVYTPDELLRPRESPFGNTNGDLKRGLEFGYEQYSEIDKYCKSQGILWFASPWDKLSVDFLEEFDPPCYKVASASLVDYDLLSHIKSKGRPVILSTGMSTIEEIERAVQVFHDIETVILHCTSSYPCPDEELILR